MTAPRTALLVFFLTLRLLEAGFLRTVEKLPRHSANGLLCWMITLELSTFIEFDLSNEYIFTQ